MNMTRSYVYHIPMNVMCLYPCLCMRACVCVRVQTCACMCVCACVCVYVIMIFCFADMIMYPTELSKAHMTF